MEFKKTSKAMILALCLVGLSFMPFDFVLQPVQAASQWNLIMEDNFSGTTVDSTKWNVVDNPSEINNEPQYYSPDNVTVNNGNLVIKTEKRSYGGRAYCSGEVTTQNKVKLLYGKIEVRAKFGNANGLWPAIWTCSNDIPGYIPHDNDGLWPPEEDLFEGYGSNNTRYTCGHWYGKANVSPGEKKDKGAWTGSDWTQDYHIWAMEWEPGEVRFYCDGVLRKTSRTQIEDNEYQHLLINVAITPSSKIDGNLQSYSYVDWVKMYSYSDDRDVAKTINDNDTNITYTGNWTPNTDTNNYHGDYHSSNVANSSYTINFTGTQAKLYGQKNDWCGKADVFVDGIKKATIDNYSANKVYSVLYYDTGALTAGSHTLQIVVLGQKSSSARESYIECDKVEIYGNNTTNLARGKNVTASSYEGKGYEAANVVDSSYTTRWASQENDSQWIYVDLATVQSINRVKLNWENAFGASYKVQISDDAVNWTNVYSTTFGKAGINDISFATTNARYVRMQGIKRGTSYGYSLYEFEVY